MNDIGGEGSNGPLRVVGLLGGLSLFGLILLVADLDPLNPPVTRTAAVAGLMAVWWITEAVPLAITAMLPMILFPALGVMDSRDVAGRYINDVIFLFLGGFLVAQAMERWELHRRIALRTLLLFGVRPRAILFGFMATAGFLSMWISNTAAAMIMVPIVIAVSTKLEEECGDTAKRYAIGLLLGIAYACSIGGVATLVGTPPNAVFVKIYAINFPDAPEITFAQWFLFGTPLSILFGLICWWYLSAQFIAKTPFCVDRSAFVERYRSLGAMSYEEKVTAAIFSSLALLWMSRSDLSFGFMVLPGWGELFPEPGYLTDGSVSVAMAGLLFLIPSRAKSGERLLAWDAVGRLPWGVVLLFGGGFALAGAFRESGLSCWLGLQLAALEGANPVLVIFSVNSICTFLTELTSNTATSQIILPILASLADGLNFPPMLLMIPATVAHSFAFMLPVATPPNAIVFGSGRLTVMQMAKTGLALNLIGIIILTISAFTLAPMVFGFDLGAASP